MLIRSIAALEMPHIGIFFYAHYKNAFPVIIIIFCDRDSWQHAWNCSQYIVSDTNKLCKVWFRQKAEYLIKISTKFLGMVTIRNIEMTTVYLLFFVIYSIFSNRNQISLSSSKVYDRLITMTGKKLGCPCSLVRYSHFSTDRA